MSHRKKEQKLKPDYSLVCRPLDTYSEIMLFLENPPPWRSLCKGMTPHSKNLIRNVEINKNYAFRTLDIPEHFCHFDPDSEEVKRYESKSLRKTLVCHDMANGYHEDSLIDGSAKYDGYTFYNWAGIDIFCYFSHHLITIPPVAWINTGHAHGVKVIGTIITEWAEGIAFWDQILASETEYQKLASALVAIAKTLKFDGWLLNVENKISKPETLLAFVEHFHGLLHSELEDPVLVWYDSVTIQGNLNWQNGLNAKNKAFFNVCDGFFTNYSWSVDDVISSAMEAEERVTDLFIGIDVWGRNFFGGGQFNTQEAIKVAYRSGCSLAIFAPAWTHEALCSEQNLSSQVAMGEYLDQYGMFLLRDRALWGSIWPFLNTKVPCQMPFQTSFCRGQGKKRRLYGEVLSPSPWYNLRHQQYQPNAAHGPHCYILTTEDKITKAAEFKDKKGIIRYRTSFQKNLQHGVQSADESVASGKEEEMETTDGTATDNEQKTIKKTKMKYSFRNLFKQKSVKTVDEVPSLQVIKNEEPAEVRAVEQPEERAEDDRAENRSQELAEERAEKRAVELAEERTEELVEPRPGPSSTSGVELPSMQDMSVNIRLGANPAKTRFCLAHVSDERECLELHMGDSFTGGSCLKVNPSDQVWPEHRFIRLFYCDFSCEDTLVFCVVTKTLQQYTDQTLNVNLFMKNADGEDLTVVLTGRNVAQKARLDRYSTGIKYVYPLNTASEEVFRDLRSYLLLNEPGFYVPIENCYDWTVRYYQMSVPGSHVSSINLRTGLPQGGILLGHFGVCRRVLDQST